MKTLTVTRGDTFRLECEWIEDGVPRSLAGVTVAAWLTKGSSTLVLDYEVVDAPNSVFALTIPQDDIDDLSIGTWRGDVEFTQSSVVISTEVYTISVRPDVTNAPLY